MSVGIRSQIEQKLVGKMALSSRAFLWLAAAGIIGAVLAFAYVQRSFTPTIDLYFQTGHGCSTAGGFAARHHAETLIQRDWHVYAALPAGEGSRAAPAMRARLVAAGFADLVIWREAYLTSGTYRRDRDAARRLGLGPPWYSGADGVGYRLR